MSEYFFCSLDQKIDIKWYSDNLQILPTGNSTDICRYSNEILKHM